ncbi:MAG TPA: hypothetical protein VH969_09645 [Actinophytocola sp.]|jgi:hypothetical protein|uniref:hypothetical protein n=1 Tax=Actinophytocola sp. TaxID=1872138 RepID=UPI002F93BA24
MANDIPDTQWWSETESPKAWMSVRDADLYEALLHRLAVHRAGQTLRVVEWGAGKSTLWYTAYLDRLGVPYSWLALEHNKSFFDERCAAELRSRDNTAVVTESEVDFAELRARAGRPGVLAVLYDAGNVRPDLPGREADREVDLDAYVSLPARLGITCDLAVVDGRKRRRCVLEASRLIGPHGYAILHDAWRTHYQCAFTSFTTGRRFGDEWWIGTQRATRFEEVLPWHALERHALAETA